MHHSDQIEYGKRLLMHLSNRTTDMSDEVFRCPVRDYTSPEILRQEKQELFMKRPILAGFSTDFGDPGDYKAETYVGVPTLMVRGSDGEMKAYLNICRHRASPLAEGCGKKMRFTCPYHAWTYGLDGQLVSLPGEEGFNDLDRATLNLRPLPVQEKYGMIWLGLDSTMSIDIDEELCALKADFEAYGYESYHHYRTMELHRDLNWKLMIDTFLESYHLKVLHRNSIRGTILSDRQLVDAAGSCERLIQPRDTFESDFRSKPEAEWDLIKHTAVAYVVFPNTMFIMQSDHVEIWRVFPDGDNPNRCKMYFDVYVPGPTVTEKAKKYWDANIDYGVKIVLEEDVPLGEKNQAAFNSGAIEHVNFGRNELGLTNFHKTIQAALAAGQSAKGSAATTLSNVG